MPIGGDTLKTKGICVTAHLGRCAETGQQTITGFGAGRVSKTFCAQVAVNPPLLCDKRFKTLATTPFLIVTTLTPQRRALGFSGFKQQRKKTKHYAVEAGEGEGHS